MLSQIKGNPKQKKNGIQNKLSFQSPYGLVCDHRLKGIPGKEAPEALSIRVEYNID